MPASAVCFSSEPRSARGRLLRSARLLEGRRVDAVALAGGRRTVLEDVPEMSAAPPAMHLDPLHSVARVALRGHGAWIRGAREAWPAAAAFELLLGAEE